MREWMDEFRKYLTTAYPALEESGGVDDLRAAVCENISLYMEKNEEEFQAYLNDFALAVWGLLGNVSASPTRERLTVTAIKFLTTVSTSVHHGLFAGADVIRQICQGIVIPNVRLREEDEELFEMNYVEFIRRDMEGSDLETRRRIACELLKGIAGNYKVEVTNVVAGEIQNRLALFAANPAANWKEKDCSIYLVVSLGTKRAGGNSVSTDLVNVENFFVSFIVPELQSQDVNGFPLLKAGALKFFTVFRNQIPKHVALALVPHVIRFLGSESNVVHSYASTCIEKLLLVKDETGLARYTSADITPYLLVLMTNLFNALKFPESEENPYVMKCIMRVLGVADISPEVAWPCITGLTSVLGEVCKNPKNPTFNHYLFEAVAVLVKRACERDPTLVSDFEKSLSPSLQMILVNDVSEFFPYAFQLLAQLVELTRPPIPASYMQIFELLLSPEPWKKHANVPALVRLLQAFLQKATHELNGEGKLSKVLEIFGRLIQSPGTDEQGFYVLNTLTDNLGYDVIGTYMSHIWAAIFERLQKYRAVRFVKSMLIFMSLFVVKYGATNLESSMNAVQPGIFLMILEQFWIPNLKLITGRIEVKLTSVASTKLICECPILLGTATIQHWGKMLDSITTLLSQPEEDRVEEEPDVPDIGETVGYTASFVRLHNAGKKEEDPLENIKDPKEFLVAALANLCASSPGRFPQIISQNLDSENQASLLQLFNTYNMAIV